MHSSEARSRSSRWLASSWHAIQGGVLTLSVAALCCAAMTCGTAGQSPAAPPAASSSSRSAAASSSASGPRAVVSSQLPAPIASAMDGGSEGDAHPAQDGASHEPIAWPVDPPASMSERDKKEWRIGQQEARVAFGQKRYELRVYGYPEHCLHRLMLVLGLRRIYLRRVAGCTGTDALAARARGFNGTMRELLKTEHGYDIIGEQRKAAGCD